MLRLRSKRLERNRDVQLDVVSCVDVSAAPLAENALNPIAVIDDIAMAKRSAEQLRGRLVDDARADGAVHGGSVVIGHTRLSTRA